MSQTEFALILQDLTRLEEVLQDSIEISSSGQDLGHVNEALHLVESLRTYLEGGHDKYKQETFDDSVSSNRRPNMDKSLDVDGSARVATSCRIKHRIQALASRLKSNSKTRRKRKIKIFLSDNELR